MIRIIEGQSRKFIQGGAYAAAGTVALELLAKGAFVAVAGSCPNTFL